MNYWHLGFLRLQKLPNRASWAPVSFLKGTTWWIHFSKKIVVVLPFTLYPFWGVCLLDYSVVTITDDQTSVQPIDYVSRQPWELARKPPTFRTGSLSLTILLLSLSVSERLIAIHFLGESEIDWYLLWPKNTHLLRSTETIFNAHRSQDKVWRCTQEFIGTKQYLHTMFT